MGGVNGTGAEPRQCTWKISIVLVNNSWLAEVHLWKLSFNENHSQLNYGDQIYGGPFFQDSQPLADRPASQADETFLFQIILSYPI